MPAACRQIRGFVVHELVTAELLAVLGILEAAAEQDHAEMPDEEQAWDNYIDALRREPGEIQYDPPTLEREGRLKTRLLPAVAELLSPDKGLV